MPMSAEEFARTHVHDDHEELIIQTAIAHFGADMADRNLSCEFHCAIFHLTAKLLARVDPEKAGRTLARIGQWAADIRAGKDSPASGAFH